MSENEFRERFPDAEMHKQKHEFEPYPVNFIKEVRDLDEAEKLFKEGWILITAYTNIQNYIVIFGRKC